MATTIKIFAHTYINQFSVQLELLSRSQSRSQKDRHELPQQNARSEVPGVIPTEKQPNTQKTALPKAHISLEKEHQLGLNILPPTGDYPNKW